MIRLFLSIAILAFISLELMATHIVGGEMYYDQIGPEEYQITLKVYRDCDPNSNTNNTNFDLEASIGIYQGSIFYDNLLVDLEFSNVEELPVSLDNPCFVLPPNVCVEEAIYQTIISLPQSTLPYNLVYQRCCRNPTIINLILPEESGATFTTRIPGTALTTTPNSSPRFTGFPPVALCTNAEFSFNHSAIDPDGDSLVYEFCAPFLGGTPFEPAPSPPSGPPFVPVTFAPGYSFNNPISADPAFSIDPESGLLSGTANLPGQYVLGICVREYRDGVELSRSNRDFQFNVVACDPVIIAAIPEQDIFCDGLTFQFSNSSTNGTFFEWDFGDDTTLDDTSTDPSPLYTYPDTGIYQVRLIANPGWSCADTAYAEFAAYPELEPSVIELATGCVGNEPSFSFEAGGQIEDPDANYFWDFGGAATPETSELFQANDIYLGPPGEYTVTLTVEANGCEEVASVDIVIPEPATAVIPDQDTFCNDFSYEFGNESLNAVSYVWDFGDLESDNDISNEEFPSYTYPGPGTYTVRLSAFSEAGCSDTDQRIFDIQTLLAPSFDVPDPQCFEGHSVNLTATGSAFENSTVSWNLGAEVSPSNSNQINVSGIQFPEPGYHIIELTIAENGCERSFTDSLLLISNPTVDLSLEGAEGCSPLRVQFENLSEADIPLVYLWEFGDGSSSDEMDPIHIYTSPGSYDVQLTVSSVLGCVITESIEVENAVLVRPDPIAGFIVSPTELSIFNSLVSIEDTSQNAIGCVMTMGNEAEIAECNFDYLFESAGIIEIQQTVVNEFGCADESSRFIKIEDFSFYAPNAFSPNSDGVNDVFRPVMLGISSYHIQIYDRWGSVIFESYDQREPWIGNVKGGDHYAENGVYLFKVRLNDMLGFGHEFNGHVVLIR